MQPGVRALPRGRLASPHRDDGQRDGGPPGERREREGEGEGGKEEEQETMEESAKGTGV